jgi:hypothetical protein
MRIQPGSVVHEECRRRHVGFSRTHHGTQRVLWRPFARALSRAAANARKKPGTSVPFRAVQLETASSIRCSHTDRLPASAHTATYWRRAQLMSAGARNTATNDPMMQVNPLRVSPRRLAMLYTIAVVLIILWALGLVSSVTMGGLIHVLLVIAVVVILLRVLSGRSAV